MPMLKLNMESLAKLKGGLVAIMLEKQLGQMARDIEHASDIKDWRKVTLEIRARPVLDMGELDSVEVEFVVTGRVPARVTSSRMITRDDLESPVGQRQLFFQLDAPDNPAQQSLLDDEGDDS